MEIPTDPRYLFIDTIDGSITHCFVKFMIFYVFFEDRK